jgi:integrase
MGSYTTKIIDENTFKEIVTNIRDGYTDHHGTPHKPNRQIAFILVLQANLGCRINDIINLTVNSFEYDGEAWRLSIKEQKTGKARPFIVPTPVKDLIDRYVEVNHIQDQLFTIKAPAVWKAMRNITEYLNIENVSCHSMRKMASYRVYKQSNKDIALVSQFLNHSNTSTTLRYLKRSSKQMDDVLSQSTCLI